MEVALILATMICSWASAALAMLWGMLRIARRYQSRQPDSRCHQRQVVEPIDSPASCRA
ncbi:hypothetical protein RTE98_13115 [Stutzerimonas frequens]|uniref:hypothetical protein n=1 Tax=Stutzerimonas frequens TaxID=2968969 RepID=UPI0013A67F00|nr:hypothetical protein [Stutzerimonas frequens]WCR44496.1 hypothetical protein OML25_00475 [Stutzerimonas stutzeri]WOC77399.1 hypothetical protein RTE98_13115 [Stutzerimonas frequens]WRW28688.1 hypothetical protein VQ574_08170 [Stutzerimonas frequens]